MEEKNNTYTGWKKWTPTIEEWAALSTFQGNIDLDKFAVAFPNVKIPDLIENEYLLVYSTDDTGKKRLVTQYIMQDNMLKKFGRDSISFRSRKSSAKSTEIVARNDEQVCAINLLHNRDITIKLIEGSWGVGKTMLLVTAALEALEHNIFDRIVWIRNNVRVAGTPDLGALPGDKNEKLMDYVGPFVDHCGKAAVECMLNNEQLIIEPLQSIRGRNIDNAIIMCSEAENLLTSHIQLIIARAAEGSEVWFDGDMSQVDGKIFRDSKGLDSLKAALMTDPLFGYVKLVKSERSKTAACADKLNKYNTDKK